MPNTTPLTDAINALTTYANETTGASDTDLSSAVATLVAGYGGGGVQLPTGYTLLNYVDTNGACAIDLGIKFTYPSTGYHFYNKFGVLNASATQIVWSSMYVSGSSVDQLVLIGGKIRIDRNSTSTNRFRIDLNDIIEYHAVGNTSVTNSSSAEFAADITRQVACGVSPNSNMINISPSYNFTLFAEYKDNSYTTFATVRFYELYYKEGSTEIIHLYPVTDTNNTPCLYDTVSGATLYPTTGQLVTA